MKHVSFSSGARLRLAGLLAVALCSVPAAADAPSPSASVAPAPPASAAPVAPPAPSASPPAAAPPAQSAPPPASPPVPTTGAPAAAWEKIGDSDGIVAYRREVPGSSLIAVKGDGVVNASIVRVASILVDTTRATEWIDRLVDTRIVREISDTESIHYDHIGTPVVMKDRDFVTRTKLEFDAANKKLIIRLVSVTDPLAPPTDYVRGEIMQSYFVLTSTDHGTKTHVSVEVHADPKGSVAKWIVNMFQKSWPHNTLSRLRMQAAKTDIKDHARLKTVLTQSGYLN